MEDNKRMFTQKELVEKYKKIVESERKQKEVIKTLLYMETYQNVCTSMKKVTLSKGIPPLFKERLTEEELKKARLITRACVDGTLELLLNEGSNSMKYFKMINETVEMIILQGDIEDTSYESLKKKNKENIRKLEKE